MPKQIQQHGPRSTFRVFYKQRVRERGKQEGKFTLKEVLYELVSDWGADEVKEACKRMEWFSSSDPASIEGERLDDWLEVASGFFIRIKLENKHKKEHLDKLANELGIAGQLKCEVVPPKG